MNKTFVKKYDFDIYKLSDTKPIYRTKNYFIKFFNKNELSKATNEYELHKKAFELGIPCPKIIDFFEEDDCHILIMELLQGKSLADIYGDNPKNIPKEYWKQIHNIIYELYYHDIHYRDITSYNFMLIKDKIYIIDFGDAQFIKVNWFLKDFIDGLNSWNPDYE